jgi:hypothetical protein
MGQTPGFIAQKLRLVADLRRLLDATSCRATELDGYPGIPEYNSRYPLVLYGTITMKLM